MSWFNAAAKVCVATFPDMWASSLRVNMVLSTPQLCRCHCAAVNFLYFQTELHSSSVFWMTCPEAVHPFISWLKVRAQAQKTLWIQYHTVNKHTCTHADKQTTKLTKYMEKKRGKKRRLVHRDVSLFDILLFGNIQEQSLNCPVFYQPLSVQSSPCSRTNLCSFMQG